MFVLAATLTLLPLALFTLDAKLNRFSLPWVRPGASESRRFAAWGERLWRRPVVWGLASLVLLLAFAAPVLGLRTAMPSIKVLPEDSSARVGYLEATDAFGVGAPGVLQVVVDSDDTTAAVDALSGDRDVAGVLPG